MKRVKKKKNRKEKKGKRKREKKDGKHIESDEEVVGKGRRGVEEGDVE